MSLTLSVVIITLNEENIIGQTLAAAKKVSDDIIVVDSFSTDRTPEICQQHGVRFYQREWEGFSSAKNYGSSLAKNDMILSLDADEVLSEELTASLNQINDPDCRYYIDLRLVMDGRVIKHGRFAERKFRIYNRQEAQWNQQLVHEGLVYHHEPPSKKKVLKGYLYHYSYPTLYKYVEKMNHYTSLYAVQSEKAGKRPASIFKAVMSTIAAFIRTYFFKKGFLDGKYGFILSSLDSFYHFLKYIKTIIK